ncbi:MAG TPA: hypothetical protein VH277_20570 [Gemmatimonadaceae bacterium]|nr:hypothetical protein [Gemmatimonadaceae bacterium]
MPWPLLLHACSGRHHVIAIGHPFAAGAVRKTRHLYDMKPRLVNVRLDADYARKAKRLQERGVILSDLVREAINARYSALTHGALPGAKEVIARIFERYPDEADATPRDYDVHSGPEARAAIRRRLSDR